MRIAFAALAFMGAVTTFMKPLAAESLPGISSNRPPSDLKQCLTQELSKLGELIIVSPQDNNGFTLEIKPLKGGKSSSIVVAAERDKAMLLGKAPKSQVERLDKIITTCA